MIHLGSIVLISIGACWAESVCYPEVGCFNNSDPFKAIGSNALPDSPEKIGTVFLLYTRQSSGDTGERLSYTSAAQLRASKFNPEIPVKFIIHGFTQSENETWLHSMKDALLNEGNFNVIITGWKKGAAGPDYPNAAANTRVVGKQVALLVQKMLEYGSKSAGVHLIGHSLGAHISGYAGSNLNGVVGRISGLDPAGPSFEDKDALARLDPGDAIFVDAIHTNGAPFARGGAGMSETVGHVDFYPNGGKKQPGCPDALPGSASALVTSGLSEAGMVVSCSHDRSIQLYLESITSKKCPFVSFGCLGDYETFLSGGCGTCAESGCSEMGYHADKHLTQGTQYLLTNDEPDYCGFPGFVIFETAATDVVGEVQLILYTEQEHKQLLVQSRKQKLPGATRKKLVLFPVELGSITSLDIMYTKYEGQLFHVGEGPQSWPLTKMTLEKPDGSSTKYCSKGNITTGVVASLSIC